GDHERLAVALEALGAQVERQALALEAGGVARVLEIELRGGDVVDRALEVALADRLLIPRPLRALQFPLRRIDGDLGEIGLLLARHDLAADLDLLAGEGGVEAVERGALALVLAAEVRAVEGRER